MPIIPELLQLDSPKQRTEAEKQPAMLYWDRKILKAKTYFKERPSLQYCEETKTITFADAVWTSYTTYKDRHAWVLYVLGCSGIYEHRGSDPKSFNKYVQELLQCNTSFAYSSFKKLQYKMFVAPYLHILNKVYFYPGRISCKHLNLVAGNYDILHQAYKDKMYNLLPILAITPVGVTPKELKKLFGPAWVKLCNNSLNKNRALASHVLSTDFKKDWITALKSKVNTPTTLLKVFKTIAVPVQVFQYLENNFKGKWRKMATYNNNLLYATAYDTHSMCVRLGYTFNPKWSLRRMEEEHHRLIKKVNENKYSKIPFPNIEKVRKFTCVNSEYDVRLLTSPYEVWEEGNEMQHCVASYNDRIQEGNYLVYSISKGGSRVSTLGIYRHQVGGLLLDWEVNQHYGKYNSDIRNNQDLMDLEKAIVENLNTFEFVGKHRTFIEMATE